MRAVGIDAAPALPAWVWLGVPAAGVLALYLPLGPDLVREWAEFPNLSHGFAIPVIAAYLAWSRRDRLRRLPWAPTLWGAPILGLALAALVIGMRGEESFLARLSLPVALIGLVVLLTGWRVAREVWLAIAFLVFMIPLPWATLKLVTYRSRLFDAAVAAQLLRALGVPVFRDGVLLQLPNITLEVADECSSIPALAALLALGMAYATLTWRPLPARVLLVLATLPLAISANIIRITSLAVGAYYVGPWTLATAYHMFNGTVNFLLTLLLLLALDAGLARVSGRGRR